MSKIESLNKQIDILEKNLANTSDEVKKAEIKDNISKIRKDIENEQLKGIKKKAKSSHEVPIVADHKKNVRKTSTSSLSMTITQ